MITPPENWSDPIFDNEGVAEYRNNQAKSREKLSTLASQMKWDKKQTKRIRALLRASQEIAGCEDFNAWNKARGEEAGFLSAYQRYKRMIEQSKQLEGWIGYGPSSKWDQFHACDVDA